jgi:heptose-I-phosphate ethanolaminephosphotransferase
LHTNLYHRENLKPEELEILSEYDNATRYNDDVLRMIIEKFKKTNTIILYLSDHGEECYDEIHTFGRTHNSQITKDIAKNEFEIPFWIWCSEEYKSKHAALVEAISQSTDKPFFSSDLGFLMLRIAGISCDYYDKKRDILDDNYKSVRKRLLRGSIYYEDLFTKQHYGSSSLEQDRQ